MRRSDGERRSDYKGAQRAKAAALYISGWSIDEVAAELNIGYTRAHTYLVDMQVKMRPPGRPREGRP